VGKRCEADQTAAEKIPRRKAATRCSGFGNAGRRESCSCAEGTSARQSVTCAQTGPAAGTAAAGAPWTPRALATFAWPEGDRCPARPGFLQRAHSEGLTFVLVITGKGRMGAESERGVLRRQVPQWLSLPEFRSLVVGFEEAHIGHGGEGALYVRIRRSRG
jgi:hypothetical protein